jgi:hypothetical protein
VALSVVKEQLSHYIIRKACDEECKSSLAQWKGHESQFSYVLFVAQQILGIYGSQVEVERVFNIVDICIIMQQSKLGTENLEMFENIYKNCPYDVRACTMSMENFMEM